MEREKETKREKDGERESNSFEFELLTREISLAYVHPMFMVGR